MASYTDILKSFTAAQNSATANALKSLQMDRQLEQQQFQNQLALDEFDYRKNQDEQTRREQQQRNMVTDYFTAAQLADTEARTKQLADKNAREQTEFDQNQTEEALSRGFAELRTLGYGPVLDQIISDPQFDTLGYINNGTPEGQMFGEILRSNAVLRKHLGGEILSVINPNTGRMPNADEPHVVEIASDITGTTSAMTLNRTNEPGDPVAVFKDRAAANRALKRAMVGAYIGSGEQAPQDMEAYANMVNNQSLPPTVRDIPLFNPGPDTINATTQKQSLGAAARPANPNPTTQTPLGVPDADPNMMRDAVESARDGYELDDQAEQQIDLNNRLIAALQEMRKKSPKWVGRNSEAGAIDREIGILQNQNAELAATIKQPLERLDQQPADPRGLGQITADANTAVSSYAAAQSDRANRVASSAQALASTVVPSLATQLQRQGNAAIENINAAQTATVKDRTAKDLEVLNRLLRNGAITEDVYKGLVAGQGADGQRANRLQARVDDGINSLNSTQGDLTSLTNNTVNDLRQREEFAANQAKDVKNNLNSAIQGVNTEVADSVRRLNITDEEQANILGEKVETAIAGQGFKEFEKVWTRNGNPDTWVQTMTDAAARRVLLDGVTEFQLAIDTVNSGDRSTELDGKVVSRLQRGTPVKFYQRLMNSSIADPRNISAYYLQRASGLPPKAFLVNVLAEASGVLNREIRPAEMERLAGKMTVLYGMFPQYRNQPEVVSAYMIDQLTGGK